MVAAPEFLRSPHPNVDILKTRGSQPRGQPVTSVSRATLRFCNLSEITGVGCPSTDLELFGVNYCNGTPWFVARRRSKLPRQALRIARHQGSPTNPLGGCFTFGSIWLVDRYGLQTRLFGRSRRGFRIGARHWQQKKPTVTMGGWAACLFKSGRKDLNLRPLRPERSALPG